jgi:tetrapyrrole methylase family protein / MazG family protein
VAAVSPPLDATRVEVEAAGRPGPFLVAQFWSREVASRVKLALDTEIESPTVVVLHHLGLPEESIVEVALCDLDRVLEPDHLTSLWVPALSSPVAPAMAELEELVRTLRERCPWDREQTHASLTRHLIEESYEVLDAIAELTAAEAGPTSEPAVAHLEEELGDLLFQVFFHSRLAAEEGFFTLADVARGVHDKLVGRHPHVFGDVTAETPGAVMANWEVIKAAEKGRSSVTEGIPTALPALLLAGKLQRKAHAIGLSDGAGASPSRQLEEAVAGLRRSPGADAVGALLYAAVAVAADLGVDAEDALRAAALRERDRIVDHEQSATPAGP